MGRPRSRIDRMYWFDLLADPRVTKHRTSSEILVAFAIAMHIRDTDPRHLPFPSLATLKVKTQLDVKTIQRAIKGLSEGPCRLIVVHREKGRANRYEFVNPYSNSGQTVSEKLPGRRAEAIPKLGGDRGRESQGTVGVAPRVEAESTHPGHSSQTPWASHPDTLGIAPNEQKKEHQNRTSDPPTPHGGANLPIERDDDWAETYRENLSKLRIRSRRGRQTRTSRDEVDEAIARQRSRAAAG